MLIEDYINSVVKALGIGASIDDIHKALIEKGCQEYDVFLVIKAGELLYNSLKNKEQEIKSRPAPFGRK